MIILFIFASSLASQLFLQLDSDSDLKQEYISVVDGVVGDAAADIKNYGFYSVTAQELSDDIDALEALYEIMDEDEVVEINGIKYGKEDIKDYAEVDKENRLNFEDDEAIIIYDDDRGSEIVTLDELKQLEEQVIKY